jgi:hypothetical protein
MVYYFGSEILYVAKVRKKLEESLFEGLITEVKM